MHLFTEAAICLTASDVDEKLRLTEETVGRWQRGELDEAHDEDEPPADVPGRPENPVLVDPRTVPRRRMTSKTGRAALVHAVAHIEFNAINLAWDAVQRFRGMPRAYYDDWTTIALEEASHFRLMRDRLRGLNHGYGDFPAHDGLWDMARRTAHDPLLRMALVPRVLEARGLDVTPGMIERLEQAGDSDTADALRVIYRDEIGHVATGTRWFRNLCHERRMDPEPTFLALLREHLTAPPRGPFNHEARLEAGFTHAELDAISAFERDGFHSQH